MRHAGVAAVAIEPIIAPAIASGSTGATPRSSGTYMTQ
jgi:hypothetical protein